MKKKSFILFIVVILFIGMVIGSQPSSIRSQYFEQQKDDFENSITKPGNDYTPKPSAPEGGLVNEIAVGIGERIESACKSIIKMIAGAFSD